MSNSRVRSVHMAAVGFKDEIDEARVVIANGISRSCIVYGTGRCGKTRFLEYVRFSRGGLLVSYGDIVNMQAEGVLAECVTDDIVCIDDVGVLNDSIYKEETSIKYFLSAIGKLMNGRVIICAIDTTQCIRASTLGMGITKKIKDHRKLPPVDISQAVCAEWGVT